MEQAWYSVIVGPPTKSQRATRVLKKLSDVFSRFMFNDTVTEQWQFVRNITEGIAADSPTVSDQYMPYYDISSPNLRCGRGAATSGPGTQTATVVAGSEVGFVIGRSADEPLEPYIIYHNGPGMAYMSKSTVDNLDDYEGDGDWFKIAEFGPKDDTTWITRDQTGMNFTIPRRTPPGKYLLRVEHLYVRPSYNSTQFYIACAQVDVLGPGGGVPEPLVKFPGAYDLNDRGIMVEQRIYEWPLSGLLKYQMPGPKRWEG
ncbi:lytic polysaccharide monooxygenase [Aaosphaeria arxii CBS 175.79]|uniref:lytic cellulose monooxygenase (C4-dehydrogenating) n=1 Tax=Aaosphaeria arxii CBS 175.79 TaxID=1450172 RepID=A0A6A5Y5H9_9PLEO|nr:lytic polysaccharide monooxygenase [Aaosphaeria arxii CBS 175.79]KAF2020040.1 lytic polysaccharide monooxygenase [Aaosphaeria arxii CBS 175.79]